MQRLDKTWTIVSAARRAGPSTALSLLALLVLTSLPGCRCSPADIDVTPDCPGGTRLAASISISANLSAIRPLEGSKQIRVSGDRTSTDVCFAPGAEQSFATILEGSGPLARELPNLADGGWNIRVIALSGGDQDPVEFLPKVLSPGDDHPLTISGNEFGDLTAHF